MLTANISFVSADAKSNISRNEKHYIIYHTND